MRAGRIISLTLVGLVCLAPIAGAQDLIERRPREEYYIEPRGVSLDQAVQIAQRHYKARAVKAETVNQGGRSVHKIRLMSSDGTVWHVYVDAQSGAMN
ncbi:MAG TPA: PepSY domain-containing protein [Steroidobacter sp.]|jgi:uncharacterized membrane protein YkoI|nr:PepSY domain-containing protein [Steroidobacter sp.]